MNDKRPWLFTQAPPKPGAAQTAAVHVTTPHTSLEAMLAAKRRFEETFAQREWILIAPNGQVYADTDVSKLIGVLAKVHLDPNGL